MPRCFNGLFCHSARIGPVAGGATEAQKQKWLGAVADGDTLVAYAVTEPDAGSNLAALETTADPVTDDAGNITGYNVNGSKIFISTGGYADFITLLAKTPEGPTFFVVEKGTPGLSRQKVKKNTVFALPIRPRSILVMCSYRLKISLVACLERV